MTSSFSSEGGEETTETPRKTSGTNSCSLTAGWDSQRWRRPFRSSYTPPTVTVTSSPSTTTHPPPRAPRGGDEPHPETGTNHSSVKTQETKYFVVLLYMYVYIYTHTYTVHDRAETVNSYLVSHLMKTNDLIFPDFAFVRLKRVSRKLKFKCFNQNSQSVTQKLKQPKLSFTSGPSHLSVCLFSHKINKHGNELHGSARTRRSARG